MPDPKSRRLVLVGVSFALAGLAAFAFWPASQTPGAANAAETAVGALVAVIAPTELDAAETRGKQYFDARCAACHGADGQGVDGSGPPFVHKIYEPSHHGDMAFHVAVQNGVRAHHWRFGNMPPQPGLTCAEVDDIVRYVRAVQRANGIH